MCILTDIKVNMLVNFPTSLWLWDAEREMLVFWEKILVEIFYVIISKTINLSELQFYFIGAESQVAQADLNLVCISRWPSTSDPLASIA